ncbi:FGGY-family carbohydrate kinase [Candidatus Formimonas warabiya]|uniref:Carbohydrate kinase n=1 Tax=Formimonas warabiya TaxID=1761012 RepID=A0A3G1KQZ1_FORW1|nr:FGGY-family carbohydrate kinase [Candidatus Formimonas warabiya]ATW24874.1 hypothetical protein DCMF_08915 [Candidatus Formimonas warabiya]
MSRDYVMGVDIGTYQTKGVICNLAGDVIASRVSDHRLLTPNPGWAEHDPHQDWWEGLCEITKGLLKDTGIERSGLKGICCSTVAAGIIPVDKKFIPLRNALLYGIDTRCSKEIEYLNGVIGQDRILENCKEALSHESYGPKMLWIKNNEPDIYRRTACFTISQSFLNARLTGNNVVDYYSASGAHPLFNYDRLDWSPEMCGYVVPQEQLPRLAAATDIIGYVTKAAAEQTGLGAGTPVACGTTDAGAEALSVGVMEPGDMMIMYGSTIYILYLSDKPPAKTSLSIAPYVVKGLTGLCAGTATSGSLTRWIRDNLAAELVEAEERGGENAYDRLFDMIRSVPPGSDGVVVLPYFYGERMPVCDPDAKGIIFGLKLSHTKGHIFRAALEGIAFGIEQCLALYRKSGLKIEGATAVGGGARNSAWMQMVSDICGLEQHIPQVLQGASYGDAMIAALALGALEPKELKKWIKIRSRTVPDHQTSARYAVNRKIYNGLYQVNKQLMHLK